MYTLQIKGPDGETLIALRQEEYDSIKVREENTLYFVDDCLEEVVENIYLNFLRIRKSYNTKEQKALDTMYGIALNGVLSQEKNRLEECMTILEEELEKEHSNMYGELNPWFHFEIQEGYEKTYIKTNWKKVCYESNND